MKPSKGISSIIGREMERVEDEWTGRFAERCFFSLVVDPQDCWNVVLIELVQQLLMYESSQRGVSGTGKCGIGVGGGQGSA